MRTVLRLTGIGWYVAICLLGGGFGGSWLDGQFGSKPLMTLLGLSAGVLMAGIGMYRILATVLSESNEDSE